MTSAIENQSIDDLDPEARAKLFVSERNAELRKLDQESFMRFWTRWRNPVPDGGWSKPDVPMAMMHKARLHLTIFTEEEKALSRKWLKDNGYTDRIGGVSPEQEEFR